MTDLLEDIDLPGGVDPSTVTTIVQLWGSGRATDGVAAGKTIYGPRIVTGNPWTITGLAGNNDITNPTGTLYRVERKWAGLTRPLVTYCALPTTGGPYSPKAIETDPPDALPTLTPANLIDTATITASSGPLAVNAFQMAAVPGLVVTVPDLAYQVTIEGSGPLLHSVANSSVAAIIARTGAAVGARLATAFGHMVTLAQPNSPFVQLLLPAHSAGDYGFYVYSFAAGNITVDAQAVQPGYLWLKTA